MIPLSRPYITKSDEKKVLQALRSKKLSGNGHFTNKVHTFLEKLLNCKKALLTSSCTDALEMAAILSNIKKGDEVIVPSYTFPSTPLAFYREGAKIIFADNKANSPHIDPDKIEKLITKKTKALVIIHYAGIACDMDKILKIVKKHKIILIEDAAHAIGSSYNGKALGTFGDFGTISFHDTKNITSGEGGALIINKLKYIKRAEIIWEKGTNRNAFLMGKIKKYEPIDTGSSFLSSEINAALLYSQLINLQKIQNLRLKLWNQYYKKLKNISEIHLPIIPYKNKHNAHIFYLIIPSKIKLDMIVKKLKEHKIQASFHYLALHKTKLYRKQYKKSLKNAEYIEKHLIRLPLYPELSLKDINYICKLIFLCSTEI